MDIAVIGAGGSMGRAIVHEIVGERLLQCSERLVLVGNPEGPSAKSLYGLAADLTDGYAEISPTIEVALHPRDIRGDLIVMAGGATIPVGHDTGPAGRDALAERNLPIFEHYASELAACGHGSEIVICISNPNELCVAAFARRLGRKRVIGMGSFLDSRRFRKEIALDLGVRRQSVHGFMVGEHGFGAVPLWSSVHVYGYKEEALAAAINRIRKGRTLARFEADVREAGIRIRELVAEARFPEAFALVRETPPDVRVVLQPFIVHQSGAKTAAGTAMATIEMLKTITLGADALVSGQVSLEGEFHGVRSTIGVPFVIGNQGVDRIISIRMDEDEKDMLVRSAARVREKLDGLLI
jgi:malate dehydrogenase